MSLTKTQQKIISRIAHGDHLIRKKVNHHRIISWACGDAERSDSIKALLDMNRNRKPLITAIKIDESTENLILTDLGFRYAQ